MKPATRGIFPILIAAIALTAIILVYQIRQTAKISVDQAEESLIADTATNIPLDSSDPIIGNRGAEITITEFIDFSSKESRKTHQILVAAVEANPTKLRLLLKDFPAAGLFADDHARPHIASYCAQKQSVDKQLTFIQELIGANDNTLTDNELNAMAENVGLNTTAFTACLESSEASTKIESSVSLAEALGLKKAPQIYINNRKINYLEDIDLDDLLAELVKEY